MANPGEQRRASDDPDQPHNGPERRSDRENTTSHRRRKQDFFQKYRQPLIGLGMAGAAIPLVNAQQNDASLQNTEPADEAAATGDAAAAAAAGTNADAEEALVGKIAQSRATDQRAAHIKSAVDKFGIDPELAADIYDVAQQEGLDAKVAYGLVRTESTFKERAVSGVGARGLTQVMPKTARWLVPGTKAQDLFDRKTNLKLGFRYLNQLADKYRGNMKLALLAYNRGPGTVDRVLRTGGNPDNGYAAKVLGL
jgi:soluble lytic murein transglycosylase-like protein